ncbi:hypothetical protein HK413_08120 [Mucilaginibacter sp. S1162]|uniref:Secreted protein n=1 Tax=Mucilaginibacter humi TaxID=2732510 RepID=A0ABX1W380_9SPHI|nr:hypothetical protein [Mucilaginibacter humi]
MLLAGYLYVVVMHLQFVAPAHSAAQSRASITPKGYDKTGHVILINKKIFKTVINRKDNEAKASQHLYVTTLLFNHTYASVAGIKLPACTTPSSAFQVKRPFYLRI